MSDFEGKTTKSKKVLTLVYLLDKENILLGLKKRGFGEGKVLDIKSRDEAGRNFLSYRLSKVLIKLLHNFD